MLDAEDSAAIEAQVNPIDGSSYLKTPPPTSEREGAHPPQLPHPNDSTTTKAEKFERHGLASEELRPENFDESPAKRIKLELGPVEVEAADNGAVRERRKGVAPIKAEYVL